MQFKPPKNTDKYFWTNHAISKLRQYGLSAQRVIRVIRNPRRREIGIAENTIAVMQPSSVRIKDGQLFWSQEIWTMYQLYNKVVPKKITKLGTQDYKPFITNQKLRIISVWRYPGISPENNPIPDEILDELENLD